MATAFVAVLPETAVAADGTGTMTVAPTYVINSSTGNYLVFTYTAAGALSGGEIRIDVPAGWTPPSATGFDPSGSQAGCGDNPLTVVGSQIQVKNVTLGAGATCDIRYGLSGFNAGVTAPAATGINTFTASERSAAAGSVLPLAVSPTVNVDTDGTGTMTVNPSTALVGSGGNTHTFQYTASRSMTNGELTIFVPANWSTPSTTGNAPGFTTSTCGTVAVVGTTIHVTGINLANLATCDTVYGATTSGGAGATAPASGGTQAFTVQHQSNIAHNNLQALAVAPTISVVAPDGTGTMTVVPSQVITGSASNYPVFTYTAGAGGLAGGEIHIDVPAGWTPPSANGFDPSGTQAACGDNPITVVGMQIQIKNVTMAAGATCDVRYGLNGFNAGVTAPATPGVSVFTTSEKSRPTGTITSLAVSPFIIVGDDGTGTMTVSPTTALVSSAANTFTFTYTAARNISGGRLSVLVPGTWPAPSTNNASQGFSTSNCSGGTVSITGGNTIQVDGFTLANAASCTITYGAAPGPGATAPAVGGTLTFTTKQRSSAAGTMTDLATGSPTISVVAPDGSGTMTVAPTQVITSSTGNFPVFTYTAATGGLTGGEIRIDVPAGWTPPSATGNDPSGTQAACGDNPITVVGSQIQIKNVTLAGGATCNIRYGLMGFNAGVTAPAVPGVSVFTASEKSRATGVITALGVSPSIVVGEDGTGTMTVAPTFARAGSTGNTLTFTYTAATTISNGQINVVVPAGWSAPSTAGGNAGFTTSTCGTVAVAGQTIQVTGVNRTAAQTCNVVYGSGAPGATAPSNGGVNTFTTTEKSSGAGTLQPIPTSPTVAVVAADGTGTMTVSPTTVIPGSTGNFITFTYTAAAGGVTNGEITVVVPAGWTPPSVTGSDPSGTQSTCGTVGVAGQMIDITAVNVAGGATCDIRYGLSGFNAGVTAQAAAGTAVFPVQQKSVGAGSLTDVLPSPQLTVGADGTGTATIAPLTVSASSTANTLTVTYTASPTAGGLSNGQINVAVPAGWSAPSTTGTDPGFTSSTCGTVGAAAQTIQVSAITLAAGASCDIVYGATTSSGPGATAQAATGPVTFTIQEKSTSGGTLTPIGVSPSVTVYAADGTGTLTVAPTTVGNGSGGNTLVFTYTAGPGGTSGGQIAVDVPAGWTAPSTTGSNAGFTQSTCGSVSVAATTIQVNNVNLAAAATCTITYGSTTSGGAGADAPASPGTSTFTTQEKSTASGSLTNLASSPQVSIPSADGSGTLTVAPTTVANGSTANTFVFTYTAATGGTSDGQITVEVPAGWSTPSTTGSAAGFSQSTCGTVVVAVATIEVSGVTLASGATCTITYGATTSGGSGAAAPSVPGPYPFAAQQKSTSGGLLTNLASSPAVTVAPANVSLSTAAVTVAEGNTGATTDAGIDVVIDSVQAADVVVHVKITGGSATAGADVSSLDADVTIPGGSSSADVPLSVLGDGVVEGDETAVVTLSIVTSTVALGTPAVATVTITDDEPTETISVNNGIDSEVHIVEGGGALPSGSFTLGPPTNELNLTLSSPSATDITLQVNTVDGSATAPADYTAINQVFTIPAGATSLTIPLSAVHDFIDEPNETFVVRLSNATGAVLSATDITVTIVDSPLDVPGVTTTVVVDPTATTAPGTGSGTTTTPGVVQMPPGGLPATGSSALEPLAVGTLVILIGGFLILTRRRRLKA